MYLYTSTGTLLIKRKSTDLSYVNEISIAQGVQPYYYNGNNYNASIVSLNEGAMTTFGKYLYYSSAIEFANPGGGHLHYSLVLRNIQNLNLEKEKNEHIVGHFDPSEQTEYDYSFSAMTNDRRYLYVLHGDFLQKRDIYNFSIISSVQVEAPNPKHDLSTDGQFLYYINSQSGALYKYRCDDLSYVLGSTIGDVPTSATTDGTYIYVTVIDDGPPYMTTSIIRKFLCSDLSAVANYGGAIGSGDDQFNLPLSITTDKKYLYIADSHNNRIKKHLCSDLSYVSQISQIGIANIHYGSFSGALPLYRQDLI